ncbi:hypothetical protein PPSIR1_08596 [Plesiocystis pacifica SIR-1]|uniref:Uncharacterized protein n=1 Tax=Plesiocystis pacifica SIR-1 TaxID=391625 RepID=A6G796_9BACT|nr:hypothetical protein [Plesiocystis pacifica]EDM78230.1 hypothetical protein PPSIR1_08596 [Plesiocystis pacifica SIR-1]
MAETETITDDALLESWRQGDAAAGRALIQRHFDWLWASLAARAPARSREGLTRTVFEGLLTDRGVRGGGSQPMRERLWELACEQLALLDSQPRAEARPGGMWASTREVRIEDRESCLADTAMIADDRGSGG